MRRSCRKTLAEIAALSILLLTMGPAAPHARADVNVKVGPLPCGIYDEAVRPLVERDLRTQADKADHYTMEAVTASGRKLTVEVQGVNIRMPGERNHVTVYLDGEPYAKTSHQDVPLALNVYIDGAKYRIICVRLDDPHAPVLLQPPPEQE